MTSQTPPPASEPHPSGHAAGPEGMPPGGPQVGQFFDRVRGYGAVRPDDGRWAAGVAAGLARRWGLDPLLVRGAFVLLTIFGGFGLFLYGLGWLFLPQPDGRIHAQEVLRGTVTAGFVGGVLCLVADTGGGFAWGGWDGGPRPFGGGLVGLIIVGVVVWWFVRGRHTGGPRDSRPDGGPGGWTPGSGSSTWTPQSGQSTWTPRSTWTPTTPGTASPPADTAPDGPSGTPTEAASGPIPPYGTPPVAGAPGTPVPNHLVATRPGTWAQRAPACESRRASSRVGGSWARPGPGAPAPIEHRTAAIAEGEVVMQTG